MPDVNFDFLQNSVFWSATSSIATFLAVVVALWQTKYNHKKRIKIKFSDNCITIENSERIDLIQVIIANTGNRNVTISQLQIGIPQSYVIALVPALMKYTLITFPCTLQPEESALIQMKKSDFIKNLCEIVSKDSASKNKKLIILITDSVGKQHKLRLPKTPSQYI